MSYSQRNILDLRAAVVVDSKFSGKTTTSMLYQESIVKLNMKQAIGMARMDPKAVLKGEILRLIDEWQKALDVWNQVKDDLDFDYPLFLSLL